MHNLTSVLENETLKLLWDFDLTKKENLIKLKESEKKDKYLDFVKELKNRGI